MLRPGSIARSSAQAAGQTLVNSGTSMVSTTMLRPTVLPVRIPLSATPDHAPAGPLPLFTLRGSQRRAGPPPCRARRRSDLSKSDIPKMNIDERLERLGELSGRVGEMRSIYDKKSILREIGTMDPVFYADWLSGEGEEGEEGEQEEPKWLDWVEDAREHVCSMVASEPLPDGLRRQIVLTEDVEEDTAVVQVPLHNCLVLYFTDDGNEEEEEITVDIAMEREEAVKDFIALQLTELNRWCQYHGPMPEGLAHFLCDFRRVGAPTSRAKMALWVMWVAECCESPYWKEVFAGLPQPEDMPNPEFCSDVELYELQWAPYALPASIRRETLRAFYEDFCESELATEFGFERRIPPEEAAATAAAAAAAEEAAATAAAAAVAAEAAAAKKGRGRKGTKKAAAAQPAPAPEPAVPAEQVAPGRALRPLPPFERFLWAYCHAEARSLGNGERIVFFPQADPFMYTTSPEHVNSTVAIVAETGPTMDQFAVVATLRPMTAGEVIYANPPFGEGPADGGGGNITQFHTQFGLVPYPGGSPLEIQDLEPENGCLLDDTYKQLLGQGDASKLENVTDPRIRHLLGLLGKEPLDMAQLPPVGKIIPTLQLPKLWGPGLVAGVKRLRLEEMVTSLGPQEDDEVEDEAAEAGEGEASPSVLRVYEPPQGMTPDEQRATLQSQLYDDDNFARQLSETRGGEQPPEVAYDEFDEWRENPELRNIVEVPADPSIYDTPEGCAEWRRIVAAWNSLPRVQPSTKEHARCMDLAVRGAGVADVFSTPRDMVRELAAAETVVQAFISIFSSFPTPLDFDEEILSAAAAPTASSSSSSPPSSPSSSSEVAAAAAATADSSEQLAVVPAAPTAPVATFQILTPDELPKDKSILEDNEDQVVWSEGAEELMAAWEPCAKIETLRMRGLVAWRLEHKRIWYNMACLVEEYRDSLAEAVAAAGLAPEDAPEEGAGGQEEEGEVGAGAV